MIQSMIELLWRWRPQVQSAESQRRACETIELSDNVRPTRDKAITFDAVKYPIRATIEPDRLLFALWFSLWRRLKWISGSPRSSFSPVVLRLGDVGEWVD